MNYSLVLSELYIDRQWVLNGNTYDGLIWLDESPKPTDAELQAALPTAEAKQAAQREISELKGKLAATDYVALDDYDQDKTDVKAQRQTWRARIRELEAV